MLLRPLGSWRHYRKNRDRFPTRTSNGRGPAMKQYSSALVGFAVLRANYNAEAPSYVDNFRGFVLGALAEHQPDPVSHSAIAQEIRDRFGLSIPDLVVSKILKRARLTKLIESTDDGFVLTAAGMKKAPAIRSLRDKYLRQQNEIEDRLRSYIGERFPEHQELLNVQIAEQLGMYLERHAVPLIASSVRGRSMPTPDDTAAIPAFDYVIASFVTHLAERDVVGFSYLEEFAKGAILAAVVMLDTSSFQNSLSALSIYIDTPVLIDLLGYNGAEPMRATHQLVELARIQGASVLVFDHSLRELSGVLQSAENYSRSNQKTFARRLDLHFQDQGWTAVDIALAREAVPTALSALQVETREKPNTYQRYGLDEAKLTEVLQNVVHYKSETTRRYDVESISAIHRLRRGQSRGSLDKCSAVLLTTNSELARAAMMLGEEEHEWPLSMTDSALAGILWARSPSVAAELPRHMILAAAYAGMQPEAHLWAKYVDEVSVLESRGEVSADDAVVLRSTTVGQHALMDETLGDDSKLYPDSPVAVLQRITNDIRDPIVVRLEEQARREGLANAAADEAAAAWVRRDDQVHRLTTELEQERANARELESEKQQRLEKEESQRRAIDDRAERESGRLIKGALWTITIPLVSLTALQIVNAAWVATWPPVFTWITGTIAVVVAALALCDTIGLGTVAQWMAPLQNWLTRRISKRRKRRARLDVDEGEIPASVRTADARPR